MRVLTRIGAVVAGGVAGVGLIASPAVAGGASTQTLHLHGADGVGAITFTFLPDDGPGLPDGCWLDGAHDALVSGVSNAVEHETTNKTGDWFTTTFTGQVAEYPLVLDGNGNPIPDPNNNQNDLVDTSNGPLATGHLTTWFGQEDNLKNGVFLFTMSFRGTQTDGTPVTLNARGEFGTNANGDPTVENFVTTC